MCIHASTCKLHSRYFQCRKFHKFHIRINSHKKSLEVFIKNIYHQRALDNFMKLFPWKIFIDQFVKNNPLYNLVASSYICNYKVSRVHNKQVKTKSFELSIGTVKTHCVYLHMLTIINDRFQFTHNIDHRVH